MHYLRTICLIAGPLFLICNLRYSICSVVDKSWKRFKLREAKKPRAGVNVFTGMSCVCIVSVDVDNDEKKNDKESCGTYVLYQLPVVLLAMPST